MRPIKFRAWEPVNKIMHYMDFVLIVGDGESYASRHGRKKTSLRYRSMNLDALEVMQFTGLKDKNGIEIFEGDIIVSERNGEQEACTVSWDEDEARFHIFWYDNPEVIGNIYENPELLK